LQTTKYRNCLFFYFFNFLEDIVEEIEKKETKNILIWDLHYIYKFYILLFLQQFTYSNKAIPNKKKKKKKKKRETTISIFIIYLASAQY